MPCILGILVATALFTITYFGKHLTLSGAVLVAIIVMLFASFNLWNMLALLLVTYIVIMLVDKIASKHRDTINCNIISKSGARSAKQILVNGFAALLATALFVTMEYKVFLIVFAVGVGETFADSIASDIGVLAKKAPRDICTWKQIVPGLSGGVSLLGIMASVIASMLFGCLAFAFLRLSITETLAILGFSILGSFVDSLFGSRVQVKYQCNACNTLTEKKQHCNTQTKHISGIKWMDNCVVNFSSNLIVCLLCFGLFWGGI